VRGYSTVTWHDFTAKYISMKICQKEFDLKNEEISDLAIFLDKFNTWINQPFEKITQKLAVPIGSQYFRQAVDPGSH
jgi:hypothetical protein